MSSSNETPENDVLSNEMPLTPGSKRDADSLFVDQDEKLNDVDGQGPKRSKTEHDSSTHSSEDEPIAPIFTTENVAAWAAVKSQKEEDFLSALKINADGRVPPYDPSESDVRPCLAIYHPSFKISERIVFEICTDFLSAVQEAKEAGYESPEINNICETVQKFLNLQHRYPSVDPVACMGEAGIGKSSFMGCILGRPGIAPESDGTKRGTCVVHEYSAALSNQTSLYMVSAVYFNKTQIERRVKKHCSNIFLFISPPEDMDDSEVYDLQKEYDTAIKFFQTLLCDREGFETDNGVREYFNERADEKQEEVVAELTAYIEDFKATRTNDGTKFHTAETDGELADIFKLVSKAPKTTNGRGQSPHPWPIIRKVQVQEDNDLLNAEVGLADTPGITDRNQAVVDATTNYLRHSGTILLFHSIKRIDDNQELDTNLRECIRLSKMRNTILIVTMIDMKERTKPEEKGDLSQEDRELLEVAERRVEKLRSEQRDIKQKKANAIGDEYRQLDQRLEDMPVKIAFAEAWIDQICIEIRSRDVAEELKGRFRELERSKYAPDLPVFFVSSTQYRKHLMGYDATQPPCLDLKGTGFPSVKHMLWEIPARGKKTTLSRICRTKPPNIFHGITGVLTKSPLARKEDVQKLIDKILAGRTILMGRLHGELRDLFDRNIKATIAANDEKWQEKAGKLLGGWANCNANTFLAFCRRSGHWRPSRKEDEISWNGKIQNIFQDKVVAAFNSLEEDIMSAEANNMTNIEELFSKLQNELDECEDFQGNSDAKPFFRMIRKITEETNKAISALFDEFKDGIRAIRWDAALLDDKKALKTSYMALAMHNTYEKCMTISSAKTQGGRGRGRSYKKSGAHPKRVEAIRQKLMGSDGEKSVFASVSKIADESFEEKLASFEDKCRSKLEECRDAIVDDFNRRFIVSEAKIEENEESREILKIAADKALDRIDGELKENVERFEAYEKSGGA